jgi:hypothetical protein
MWQLARHWRASPTPRHLMNHRPTTANHPHLWDPQHLTTTTTAAAPTTSPSLIFSSTKFSMHQPSNSSGSLSGNRSSHRHLSNSSRETSISMRTTSNSTNYLSSSPTCGDQPVHGPVLLLLLHLLAPGPWVRVQRLDSRVLPGCLYCPGSNHLCTRTNNRSTLPATNPSNRTRSHPCRPPMEQSQQQTLHLGLVTNMCSPRPLLHLL